MIGDVEGIQGRIMRCTLHSRGTWSNYIHLWTTSVVGSQREITLDFNNFGTTLSMSIAFDVSREL